MHQRAPTSPRGIVLQVCRHCEINCREALFDSREWVGYHLSPRTDRRCYREKAVRLSQEWNKAPMSTSLGKYRRMNRCSEDSCLLLQLAFRGRSPLWVRQLKTRNF